MNYSKVKADYLFNGHQFEHGDPVLVLNADGTIEAIISADDAGDDVQYFKGILSPGFINAHCHLELSNMVGLIPTGTGLIDFVFKVVTERNLAGDAEVAIRNAAAQMYQGGIVAVGDICNNLSTLQQKKSDKIAYYNFIEASGWLPDVAAPRFERSRELYDAFNTLGNMASMVPHAPYSVSNKLWDLITPYFENKVVTIHNQETRAEDEFFMHGTGDLLRMYEMMKLDNSFFIPGKRSSLRSYFPKLLEAESIILVHNTFTSAEDIEYSTEKITSQLLSFCICINANLYIEKSLPPLEALISRNINIVLGTDSLASNSSLNMIDEMRSIQQHFPAVTIEQMLKWVTFNGARALKLQNTLGTFTKGTSPGIVLIENLERLYITSSTTSRILI